MTLWYLARSAGLTAFAALSLATALGAWTSGEPRPGGASALSRRFLLQRVHLAAAVTGLALLVVHVAALIADAKSGVSASALVVPLAAAYRPVAVAVGALAMYAVVLVAVFGAARGRLAASAVASRRWRATHALAYVAWALALAHGLFAGTDTLSGKVPFLYAGCISLVAAAVSGRLWSEARHEERTLSTLRRRNRELTSGGVR
jgi:sulfoxide reductase heme-binding subunit YedZ